MIEKDSLRFYLKEKNSELFQTFIRTADKVCKDVLDYLTQEGFTNHGRAHSEGIERKLNEFLPTEIKAHMSAIEIYLLLNSIYVHDIGMLDRDYPGQSIFEIRSTHHQRSRRIITKRYKDFFLDESISFRIADISHAHGLSNLDEFDDNDYLDGYGDIRIKFLMALLRIGDILDWAKSRAPILTKEILKIGGDSYKYWIEHNFIESIRCENRSFQIDIIGIPKGQWSKDKLYEIKSWFQKELDLLSPIFEINGLLYKKINLKIQKYKFKEYSPERKNKNPFQFLLSYNNESRDLYFGRKKELNDFIENIFSNRYLFLLGESGIGKTSFIQAGLIPIFEELEINPIYIENYHNGEKELLNALRILSGETENNYEVLLNKITEKGLKIIVILDQFEKNLYDYSATIEFLDVIEKIVRNEKTDIKIIFALRDDFTKNLWDFSKERELNLLSDKNLFTLYKPSVGTIKEIVINSLKIANILLEEDNLNVIIEDMLSIHQKSFIFLPDLQIVFSALCEEQIKTGKDLFELYKQYGDCKTIITNYFTETIWEDFTEEEVDLSRKIIIQLTTLDGIREQIDFRQIVKRLGIEKDKIGNLISRLISKRIIKRFVVGEQEYFELVHDFMAKKYSETLSSEEKMKKSLNEMLRQSLNDWLRHKIVIDKEKIKFIMTHFDEIILTEDIRELLIRAICMHTHFYGYERNEEERNWLEKLNINSNDKAFLIDLLREYNGSYRRYNLTYQSALNILEDFLDIQDVEDIAIQLLSNSHDIRFCESLIIVMIPYYYWERKREHNKFTISVVKFLNGIFDKNMDVDDVTLERILLHLVDANNMKEVFDSFGKYKTVIFNIMLTNFIKSHEAWQVTRELTKLARTFKKELISEFDKLQTKNPPSVYSPGFVTVVRILRIQSYFDAFNYFLLSMPSYGNVAVKREMITAIVAFDPARAEKTLIALLSDESVQIIKDAADNLGQIGTRECLKTLRAAMEKSKSSELVAIRNAIDAIENR